MTAMAWNGCARWLPGTALVYLLPCRPSAGAEALLEIGDLLGKTVAPADAYASAVINLLRAP